jgi:hypothetical protein
VFTPNLFIKESFWLVAFVSTLFNSSRSSGTGVDKRSIMLVEHGEIRASSGGSLLVIRASRGRPDGSRDLGDGLPLADIFPPIILDGFDAVGSEDAFDTLGFSLGFSLLFVMLGH